MKRSNVARVTIGLLMIALLLAAPVRANVTIFFDDFVSSGFPVQWSESLSFPASTNTVLQSGGYATLQAERSGLVGHPVSEEGFIANSSIANSPINNATTDGQFIDENWKLQPFNMTADTSPGVYRLAEMIFGFSTSPTEDGTHYASSIYFDLWQSDLAGCGQASFKVCPAGSKSAIYTNIYFPMGAGGGTAHCFDTPNQLINNFAPPSGCTRSPEYAPTSNPIDLNAQHTFTIKMKLYPVSHTSWISFKVDNNAWINMTQQSCGCIDQTAAGGSYKTMFPFAITGYGFFGGGCCPSQSLSSAIDYVLVTDFVPALLPVGQILSSGANPPTSLQQPGTGGFSLVQFMQFEANSVSPGNIYAGGMIIVGIVSTIMFAVMGLGARKTQTGVRGFGFLYSMMVLTICYFGLFVQILPLWLPVIVTITAASIMFGIIGTGPTRGGVVEA